VVLHVGPVPSHNVAPKELWFTRCPVPTATGLAYNLGWLQDEFLRDGVTIRTLQESGTQYGRHHYDHRLPTLIREGGNILAIAARAQGEPTRLVGLTWIEESQVILVRDNAEISSPSDLKGKRLALPAWGDHDLPSHARGTSIARGMSLHGYKGILANAGLSFDDVDLVEIDGKVPDLASGLHDGVSGLDRMPALEALKRGDVDAVYSKGAPALESAREAGLIIGIQLDDIPDPRFRVNNGTPRPITVHQDLIDNHFEYLVRFLAVTLRAADWATGHMAEFCEILQAETYAGSAAAIVDAYARSTTISLHPTLDGQRLSLFEQQKKFLLLHGFLDADFSLGDWVDTRPLDAAYKLIS